MDEFGLELSFSVIINTSEETVQPFPSFIYKVRTLYPRLNAGLVTDTGLPRIAVFRRASPSGDSSSNLDIGSMYRTFTRLLNVED